MKVARTLLSGGKAGDNLKGLPIAIERKADVQGQAHCGGYSEEYTTRKALRLCSESNRLLQQTPPAQQRRSVKKQYEVIS